MTNELSLIDNIDLAAMKKWLLIAEWAVQNRVAPKDITAPQYLMMIVAGNGMGMKDLYQVNASLYIVNGRIALWWSEVLARAKRAGYKVEYPEKTNQKVTVTLTAPDGTKHTESFDMERAKVAGLKTKDIWVKYPEEMLTHKAIARAINNFCPEVLNGFAIAEDIMYDIQPTNTTTKLPKKPDLSQFEKTGEQALIQATPGAIEVDLDTICTEEPIIPDIQAETPEIVWHTNENK